MLARRRPGGQAATVTSADTTVALASPAAVRSATDAYELGTADFAACLLSMKAAAAGCDGVVTFDRDMKGLPGVRVL
jgi:predicted nucleic-acid-binding protein